MSKPHYTPTYQSWQAMKQRCNSPTHKHYQNYGGRGIYICVKWNEYHNFLADMGERPKGYSLDRIDNNVGYLPDNCRWASRTQQNRNSSQNILITYTGVSKCLSEWGEILELNYARTYARIYKLQWSIENAFILPPYARL